MIAGVDRDGRFALLRSALVRDVTSVGHVEWSRLYPRTGSVMHSTCGAEHTSKQEAKR